MARKKGSGSILKNKKTGKYYLRIILNGKTKEKHFNTKSRSEAEKKAKEFLEEHKNLLNAKSKEEVIFYVSQARNIINDCDIEVDKVWDLYIKNPARPDSSKGTLGNYQRNWNKFKIWLNENYPNISFITQVTKDISQEYAVVLWDTGISANTFNYHIQTLKLIYRILTTSNGEEYNPWNIIARKAEAKKKRKNLIKEQIIEVLNVFDDPLFSVLFKEEMRVMFHIGAWTGLRLIDCALLKWNSVNLKNNIIKLIPRKTRKIQREVTIPILPQLNNELSKAFDWKSNDYVLPKVADRYNRNESGIKKDSIKVFRFVGLDSAHTNDDETQRKLNTNEYGFHSFRHSFASFCAESGVPIVKLSKILGDNVKTLEKYYIHLEDESLRSTINKAMVNTVEPFKQLLGESNSPENKIKEALKLLKRKENLSSFDKRLISILQ